MFGSCPCTHRRRIDNMPQELSFSLFRHFSKAVPALYGQRLEWCFLGAQSGILWRVALRCPIVSLQCLSWDSSRFLSQA